MALLDHPLIHRLEQELKQREGQGLLRKLQQSPDCPWNLISNDYLQLRRHPQVLTGAQQALFSHGAGSGASPLLGGYLPCHEELLNKLKSWKSKPHGMVFNTGFTANQAVLKHLPGPSDLILADRLIHHSMAQTLTQSRAKFKRYRHIDLDHLEELLADASNHYETIFVVTESVFSMDGDYPDLKRLVSLKNKYPFILVLDEAHATGVFGPTGGGLAEREDVLTDVDILVGTLGKALASMGAYVLTQSKTLIDYLINFSGEFIYSTYLGPAQAGAASSAIDLVQGAETDRQHLRKMSLQLREGLENLGFQTHAFDSAIVPLILGSPEQTLELQVRLVSKGILTGAVRPPTVPANSSRLRMSLHSEVTDEVIETILDELKSWRNH